MTRTDYKECQNISNYFQDAPNKTFFLKKKREKCIPAVIYDYISYYVLHYFVRSKYQLYLTIERRRDASGDGTEYCICICIYVLVSKTRRWVCVVRSAGAAIENVTWRRRVGHTTFRFQHFS